jgi:hypothetical protein
MRQGTTRQFLRESVPEAAAVTHGGNTHRIVRLESLAVFKLRAGCGNVKEKRPFGMPATPQIGGNLSLPWRQVPTAGRPML